MQLKVYVKQKLQHHNGSVESYVLNYKYLPPPTATSEQQVCQVFFEYPHMRLLLNLETTYKSLLLQLLCRSVYCF